MTDHAPMSEVGLPNGQNDFSPVAPPRPLVSIIMPCYKMGPYVGEALESIAGQSHPNWELIAVDDCGPEDGTRAAILAFSAEHPRNRVQYLCHQTNLGVCAARKTALASCRGEYVAFLDADDAFEVEKLERQIAVLEADSSVVLCHTAINCLGQDEADSSMEDWFRIAGVAKKYVPFTKGGVLVENKICNSSVVCRANALAVDDLPDSMVFQFEDKLLWSRIAPKGEFYFLPERMTRYRIHGESYTSRILNRPGALQLGDVEMCLRFEPAGRLSLQKLVCYGHLWDQLATLAQAPRSGGRRSRLRRAWFDIALVCAGLISLFKTMLPGKR